MLVSSGTEAPLYLLLVPILLALQSSTPRPVGLQPDWGHCGHGAVLLGKSLCPSFTPFPEASRAKALSPFFFHQRTVLQQSLLELAQALLWLAEQVRGANVMTSDLLIRQCYKTGSFDYEDLAFNVGTQLLKLHHARDTSYLSTQACRSHGL